MKPFARVSILNPRQVIRNAYLKRVAAVGFAVYHLQDIFAHGFSCLVSVTPVICGADTIFANVEVFRIVYVLERAGLYSVDDAGFQVDQDGPRDVPSVVALVEEDVFAIATLGCKVLEISILTDSVFLTKLLPELAANWEESAIVGAARVHPRGQQDMRKY